MSGAATIDTLEDRSGRWTGLWRVCRQNPLFALGLGYLLLLLVVALLAPWLAPYDPSVADVSAKLKPPSAEHWMGTDALGRDIFSQVLVGAGTSLRVGALVVGLALLIGVPIGLVAGFFGGRIDGILMRLADVFLAFPPLLLPLAITAALGPGLSNAMIALAVSWFPWYARIMRASVLAVREELYLTAARAMGVKRITILYRHVLPNSLSSVTVQSSMDFGYAILAAASLSFIGMGAAPPEIDWGLMVANSKAVFIGFWWTAAFPGLAIFLTVLAVNLVGDGLRDLLDPKHEGRR